MSEQLPPNLSDAASMNRLKRDAIARATWGAEGKPGASLGFVPSDGDIAIYFDLLNVDLYPVDVLREHGLPEGATFAEQLFVQQLAASLGGSVLRFVEDDVEDRNAQPMGAARPVLDGDDMRVRWRIAIPLPVFFSGLPPSQRAKLNAFLHDLTAHHRRLYGGSRPDVADDADHVFTATLLARGLATVLSSHWDRRLPLAPRSSGAIDGGQHRLFHVTFWGRLPSILRDGLRPGGAQGMRLFAVGNRHGVYLTEAKGVRFWFQKAIQYAEHEHDDPVKDGMIPMVLRLSLSDEVLFSRCREDDLGSRDAYATAWVCDDRIRPSDLEVWTGDGWEPLRTVPTLKTARRGTMAGDDGRILSPSWNNGLLPDGSALE